MVKIVADNKIPFLHGALDKRARVTYLPASEIRKEQIIDADALIVRTRTKCTSDLLEGTSVRFIASATIGYDHIDTAYCDANGIHWTNAPGCNSASVKQYISSALAEIIKAENLLSGDLTIGIIGVGNVGKKVESLVRSLGAKVLLNDPPRARTEMTGDFVPLEKILNESDIVTLHVPLNHNGTDKTFHMADNDFFSGMKKGSWFINTSRGEVVKTNSLVQSLKSGQIGGAVIDVWENEPEIDPELLRMSYIATPHIAGYSVDGKANGTAMSVQAISRFFNLGLNNWFPDTLPVAENSLLKIDCLNKTIDEIFFELSNFAYNIRKDSDNLKESPGSFELLRESYPVRREPEHLKVLLNNNCNKAELMIKNLGYNMR